MADTETIEQPVGPVNTLLVVDDDVFDRLGSVIRHLCIGMMDEAVNVTVLWRSKRHTVQETIGPSRVVPLLATRWPRRQISEAQLLDLLGGIRPRVMHCLSADLARWVRRWATAWDCTVLVALTDVRDVEQFVRAQSADKVIGLATTTRVEQALMERRPTKRGRIAMMSLGIPGASSPACLTVPERQPTAIVTALMSRDGSVDLVLKALHLVRKQGLDVDLFVLSAGKGERLLRRQADQLHLRSRVTFAGPMRDRFSLINAMRSADFYIIPAARRRFRDTTLMAMAAGLAILAPTGTIEDYLIDGQTASLFEPYRADDLARKWAALLEDRAAARQLAHGALDYVRAHHQASKMVDTTAKLYRQFCR